MNHASDGLLLIAGKLREASSGARFDVVSPIDESVVGWAADATLADIGAAVGAARAAFDESDWSTNREFRKKCLRQLQVGLRKEIDMFKTVQTAEAGICLGISGLMDGAIDEIDYAIDLLDSFAWETDFPTHECLGMKSLRKVIYEPHGVVCAITAWNAPFLMALWKVVPALATGNTVVLKSPSATPLIGAMLARVVCEHTDIPAGVLNVISSKNGSLCGDALTGDPRIDMFHFTGSTAIGQRIAERAAVGIRKTVLELGGKSANILLDDAELDVAIPHSAGMCMMNSGQGCTLGTRLIVHASIYAEVVERLAAIINLLPVGDPSETATIVGPIIHLNQLKHIEGLVERAKSEGARVIVGGHRVDRGGKGFWYAPTLIVDVDENSELAQTEVFGPVLAVLKFNGSDDEAVRIANNSIYGLSGYVQTRNLERAWKIARNVRTGTFSINTSIHNSPDTPFGGRGQSGLGCEHGVDGWREFLLPKTIASPAL